MHNKNITLTLVFIIFHTFGYTQSQINVLFNSENYVECILKCEEILKKEPDDAVANFFKGASMVKLKYYEDSLEHLDKAQKFDYKPTIAVEVNLMLSYAALKETTKVILILERLSGNGFGNSIFLEKEEFRYLSGNKEFLDLKDQIYKNAFPCIFDDKYKKLDFWIGEWDVYVKDKKIARNIISKSRGGCSLYENYVTVTGFYGTSFSFYSQTDGIFKQTWVDKFGSVVHFEEIESKAGVMIMLAHGTDGILTKMSYHYSIENDQVTQTMEGSSDNGISWKETFKGVYKRKPIEQL